MSLVNEVLVLGLIEKGRAGTERELFEDLETKTFPITTPLNLNHAIVRESLNAIRGLKLNDIALRGALDAFGIGDQDYTLVPNVVDRLRLFDKHKAMMEGIRVMAGDSVASMYTDWHRLSQDDATRGQEELQSFS